MSVLEYVLDGLEAELALERELGIRFVAFDRGLLSAPPAAPVASVVPVAPVAPAAPAAPVASAAPAAPRPVAPAGRPCDFVFLHDRSLSPAGVEMMAKIITAMGRTAETAPVVVAPPLPRARYYVVLGALALRRFFPKLKGAPGQWLKGEGGEDVLVTYSPHYILRFESPNEPAVREIKKQMWTSLKGLLQRLRMESAR